jgi:hypothetical protein
MKTRKTLKKCIVATVIAADFLSAAEKQIAARLGHLPRVGVSVSSRKPGKRGREVSRDAPVSPNAPPWRDEVLERRYAVATELLGEQICKTKAAEEQLARATRQQLEERKSWDESYNGTVADLQRRLDDERQAVSRLRTVVGAMSWLARAAMDLPYPAEVSAEDMLGSVGTILKVLEVEGQRALGAKGGERGS